MDKPNRTPLLQIVLIVTLLASVGLLVKAAQGKQAVEESYSKLYERATQPYPGMYVPILEGPALDGQTVRLGDVEPGRVQLLYFFTTSCPYCLASLPTWRSLSRVSMARTDVDVIGVALDSVHLAVDYADEHGLPFPIIAVGDPRYAQLFRVTGVPLTMIVGAGGRVLYGRVGEFSTPALADSVAAILENPPLPPADPSLSVPSAQGNGAADERGDKTL